MFLLMLANILLQIKIYTVQVSLKSLYSAIKSNLYYLTIRPVVRKGYGSIAHEAKPNGLLTRGP